MIRSVRNTFCCLVTLILNSWTADKRFFILQSSVFLNYFGQRCYSITTTSTVINLRQFLPQDQDSVHTKFSAVAKFCWDCQTIGWGDQSCLESATKIHTIQVLLIVNYTDLFKSTHQTRENNISLEITWLYKLYLEFIFLSDIVNKT